MKNKTIFIFDAYGTLFDVDSACRHMSRKLGEKWSLLSTIWRQKQLEYSWLRNSMDSYINFWEITKNSLDYAMKTLGLEDTKLRQELLDLYYKIECYEEVSVFLQKIKKKKIKTCILSNGSFEMLNSAIKNSKLEKLLDKILSVDICKKFKPSKRVYQIVLDEFKEDLDQYLFFSSNCWDIHGASNFGFNTVWVNRYNKINDLLPGNIDQTIKQLNEYNI